MASLATPLVFPLGGGNNVITSADVWARDMFVVTFPEPMRADDLLAAPQAYSIAASAGAAPQVQDVLTGNEPTATSVVLVIDNHEPGTLYTITFQNLYASTGLVLSPVACELIGRTTKVDSIVNGRPRMYDIRARTRFRSLITAIGRQDDLIGGSRHDRFTIVGGD